MAHVDHPAWILLAPDEKRSYLVDRLLCCGQAYPYGFNSSEGIEPFERQREMCASLI
jgi:hypothetical protein